MQGVPIEEEAYKAEKLYCQNDKWKICNSVPISFPVPQFMTLQSFVNEGTFSSLLPKYYQRVFKKILICCFIPIHLLIQVWKYSYWHRKILTQSLPWLHSGQSAFCWLTLLTLLMPRKQNDCGAQEKTWSTAVPNNRSHKLILQGKI